MTARSKPNMKWELHDATENYSQVHYPKWVRHGYRESQSGTIPDAPITFQAPECFYCGMKLDDKPSN